MSTDYGDEAYWKKRRRWYETELRKIDTENMNWLRIKSSDGLVLVIVILSGQLVIESCSHYQYTAISASHCEYPTNPTNHYQFPVKPTSHCQFPISPTVIVSIQPMSVFNQWCTYHLKP